MFLLNLRIRSKPFTMELLFRYQSMINEDAFIDTQWLKMLLNVINRRWGPAAQQRTFTFHRSAMLSGRTDEMIQYFSSINKKEETPLATIITN